jgi:hypothetical protein
MMPRSGRKSLPAIESTYSIPRPLRRGGTERSQPDRITSRAVTRHRHGSGLPKKMGVRFRIVPIKRSHTI